MIIGIGDNDNDNNIHANIFKYTLEADDFLILYNTLTYKLKKKHIYIFKNILWKYFIIIIIVITNE